MAIYADISAKIAADREGGRDVPPVMAEYFLLIAESLDPQEKKAEEPAPAPAATE